MRTIAIALVLASFAASLQAQNAIKKIVMRISMLAFFVVVCLAPLASAQNVVVGSRSASHMLGGSATTPPYTLIDISHPANADGTVTTASVSFGTVSGICPSAFKVKFLRPTNGFSLTTFTLVAERGPFTAQDGTEQYPLSPPVAIKQGDLIAVTSLVSDVTCGSPLQSSDLLSVVLEMPGDLSSGTFSFNGTLLRGSSLNARATDTQEVLEGVIVAAGSLQGNFGSFFRTSLQIASRFATSTGKLIFHPAGAAFSSGDQVLPYSVSCCNATSFADVVQTMGKSGLGTIDIISNNGVPPLVTASVYNDAGVNGTSGFTEDLITRDAALHPGDNASLPTPADLANFRVNIGVRTFSSPATVNAVFGSPSRHSKTTFPANTFQQFSLTGFGDTNPVANELISFFVTSGDVIIYASTTDNRTNDSSVRFARRE